MWPRACERRYLQGPKVLDSPELELQVVVRCVRTRLLGIKLGSPERAAHALSCSVSSLASGKMLSFKMISWKEVGK